ncbi:MAG TPA: iron-sulfur cluster assembly accessory protein [Candidatus Nanoarchaeia archaeon]|nr:iron-sulfur cluster assembly accessory protein [Candidatus Nanoarchaeia archaeon]
MFGLFKKKNTSQTRMNQEMMENPKEFYSTDTHFEMDSTHRSTEKKITKEMTIATIVKKYPEVVDPLTAAGIHCVGCHVSPYETLEQGLLGHGMNQEAVSSLVSRLNQTIQKKQSAPSSFSLTENAAKKIHELSKNKNMAGLRVSVTPGGCSGFQYEFDLENKEQPNDIIIEQKDTKIFIQPETMEMIKGSELDYSDALQGAGFKIQNPQAKSTCGCGSSFS